MKEGAAILGSPITQEHPGSPDPHATALVLDPVGVEIMADFCHLGRVELVLSMSGAEAYQSAMLLHEYIYSLQTT